MDLKKKKKEDFCGGVVGVPERLLGLSQLRRRTLGMPIPSAQAEPVTGDDWALCSAAECRAGKSRKDRNKRIR
jgi:hypothetical protein